jgi:hypothetical protein
MFSCMHTMYVGERDFRMKAGKISKQSFGVVNYSEDTEYLVKQKGNSSYEE